MEDFDSLSASLKPLDLNGFIVRARTSPSLRSLFSVIFFNAGLILLPVFNHSFEPFYESSTVLHVERISILLACDLMEIPMDKRMSPFEINKGLVDRSNIGFIWFVGLWIQGYARSWSLSLEVGTNLGTRLVLGVIREGFLPSIYVNWLSGGCKCHYMISSMISERELNSYKIRVWSVIAAVVRDCLIGCFCIDLVLATKSSTVFQLCFRVGQLRNDHPGKSIIVAIL